MREVINFNKDWLFHNGDIEVKTPAHKGYAYLSAKTQRFHLGPASPAYRPIPDDYANAELMNSDRWQRVNLPHDFVIQGDVCEQNNPAIGFFDYGRAWYIKKFTLDESDKNKRIVLYFEGVATESTVYLNGCIMHRSFTGYTPFEVDVTDFVKLGEENHLAVFVDSNVHEGWWYSGGGIYRNVKLIKTELVSIDLYGVYLKPVKRTDTEWEVFAEITVRNDYPECKHVSATVTLTSSTGEAIAAPSTVTCAVDGKSKATIKTAFTVEAPSLWSPDEPNLYYGIAALSVDGKACDETTTHFGFRTFYADADKGFFINGKHYKIYGMCSHADSGLF